MNGQWEYSFDPLNQLLRASSSNQEVCFSYDPLGRRLAKEMGHQLEEFYLYDGANEWAAYDSDGHLKALRVPGLFQHKGTTLPVAIELEGKTYAPFLDSLHNVCRLLEARSGTVTHEYTYSAFGSSLKSHETGFNP